MAYDEYFAEVIDRVLQDKGIVFDHKRMFGGLVYMINDKMCFGLDTDKVSGEPRLMLRIDPDDYDHMLQKYGARKMDFTGRPMKGFLFIHPEALEDEEVLAKWLQLALDYNPKANRTKK